MKNIKGLLGSNDPKVVKRALALIYYSPNTELEQEISALVDHPDRRISEMARNILNRVNEGKDSPATGIYKSIDSLDSFIQEYKSFSQMENRLKLLKSLNHYSLKADEKKSLETLTKMFLAETERTVAHAFSKILIKWFGSELIPHLNKGLEDEDINCLINSMMTLMKLEVPSVIERIIELYESMDDPEFIFYASCHIWRYSKLLVITKLKSFAQDSREKKLTAAKLCGVLNHKKLKGIMQLLADDASETVRSKAKEALSMLEKRGDEPETIIRYSNHLSEDFNQKFEKILREGTDFQEKIMVMNILDNLANPEFLPTVEEELQNERNNFLIASYVKFLGKHGKGQFIEVLLPYLESDDTRIVSNCIEGLSFSPGNCNLLPVFKKFIKHSNHRISSVSASALWKNNEKDIVREHLKNSLESKKLWRRKSCMHILAYLQEAELAGMAEQLCEDPNQSIRDEAKSLLKILHTKTEMEENAQDRIIDYLIEHGKVPAEFIQSRIDIIKSVSTEMNQRIKAANELSFIATDENYKALYRCFVGASDPYLKAALVKTVGMTFSGGKDFLFDVLKKDFDPRVIANAIETLAFFDYSDRIDEIFPFLYHDNQRVVTNTVMILHSVMPEKIFHKISLMTESENSYIRKSALFALNRIKTFDSYSLIRKLVNDPDLEIAVTASEFVADFDREHNFVSEIVHVQKQVPEVPDRETKDNILVDLLEEVEKTSKQALPELTTKISLQLNEENYSYLLSYLENTENSTAKSKLCGLLGKFACIDEVRDYISTIFDSDDKRLKANTVEGFVHCTVEACFFDEILEMTDSGEERTRFAALKVMLTNPVYGARWFDLISSSETAGDTLKIRRPVEIETDPVPEKKIIPQELQTGRSPLPLTARLFFGTLIILIVFYLFKNNTPKDRKQDVKSAPADPVTSTVKEPVKPPPVAREPSNNKIPKADLYLQKRSLSDWKKICSSPSNGKEKRIALLELVTRLEKTYRNGELYTCKKLILDDLFEGAEIELKIVFNNINNGLVIKDFKTGKWVKSD